MERYVVIDTGLDGCALLVEKQENGSPVPLDHFLFKEAGWRDGIDPRAFEYVLSKWNVETFHVERVPIIPHNTKTLAKQFFIIGQIWSIIMFSNENVVINDFYPKTWQSHTRRHLRPSEANLASKKQSQIISKLYFPEFFESNKKRSNIHDGLADCLSMLLYVEREYFSQFVED